MQSLKLGDWRGQMLSKEAGTEGLNDPESVAES